MQTGWKSSSRVRGISVLIKVKKLTLFLCHIYKCFVLYSQGGETYIITSFHFFIFHTANFFEAHSRLPHGVANFFGASSNSQTAFNSQTLGKILTQHSKLFWGSLSSPAWGGRLFGASSNSQTLFDSQTLGKIWTQHSLLLWGLFKQPSYPFSVPCVHSHVRKRKFYFYSFRRTYETCNESR